MLAYAAAFDASGQHQRELQCSVAWHKVRHLSSYLRVGGWVWLNCRAWCWNATMLIVCWWMQLSCKAQELWRLSIVLMSVLGFLCVRGRFLRTARADALMYWCRDLCFWLGAYVVVGRGMLWRWGLCIGAKFDDPRESLEKLYYFGVISRIIICMQA